MFFLITKSLLKTQKLITWNIHGYLFNTRHCNDVYHWPVTKSCHYWLTSFFFLLLFGHHWLIFYVYFFLKLTETHVTGVNITAFGHKLKLFHRHPAFHLKCPAYFAYFELKKCALCSAQRYVVLRQLGNQVPVLGKANSLCKILKLRVFCQFWLIRGHLGPGIKISRVNIARAKSV